VNVLVIDASVAVKWVVDETGTPEALILRDRGRLIAPELLVPECANILWKKVLRKELSKAEALLAARLLQGSEIELMSTRSLLESATRIAIDLDHPAYDCLYLALAVENDCHFVTADDAFIRKLGQRRHSRLGERVVSARSRRDRPPGTLASRRKGDQWCTEVRMQIQGARSWAIRPLGRLSVSPQSCSATSIASIPMSCHHAASLPPW
jgi:predicted nucleic acid-binding protein